MIVPWHALQGQALGSLYGDCIGVYRVKVLAQCEGCIGSCRNGTEDGDYCSGVRMRPLDFQVMVCCFRPRAFSRGNFSLARDSASALVFRVKGFDCWKVETLDKPWTIRLRRSTAHHQGPYIPN